MGNNLFIDTDVILDIVLDRKDFFDDSSAIFQKFENGKVFLYTSSSIIINAQYVGQKQITKVKCRAVINYLLNYFIILDADVSVLKQAYQSKFSDVEDAIQYYTAARDRIIDFFITRNTKDYEEMEERFLPVVTPTQFLKLFRQNP
jgi:predicted nucleic acid-binding protein